MDTGYFTSWPPRPEPPIRTNSSAQKTRQQQQHDSPLTSPLVASPPSRAGSSPFPIISTSSLDQQPSHPLSFASSSLSSYPDSSFSPTVAKPSSIASNTVFEQLPSPVHVAAPFLFPIQEHLSSSLFDDNDHHDNSSKTVAVSTPSATARASISFAPDPTRSPAPVPSSAPPPRPFTINTNDSELAPRNAVAGGLMSSPTAMPPGTYVSKIFNSSSAPSTSNKTPNYTINNISNSNNHHPSNQHGPLRRQNSSRSSISSVSGRTPSARSPSSRAVSSLLSMTAAEKAHNNAIMTAAAIGSLGNKPKRPDIRPYYQSFGSMGLIYPPPRSMSFAGPSSTTRAGRSHSSQNVSMIGSSTGGGLLQEADNPSHMGKSFALRKSLSVGKTRKRGFATRLRKLRQRQGSTSTGFTSGESDTEGHTQHKSPSFGKAKTVQINPSLPPPPPMRVNSGPSKDSMTASPTYAIPYGFGNMGVAPLSIGTKSVPSKNKATPNTTPTSTVPVVAITPVATTPSDGGLMPLPGTAAELRESSTTRFKEMIKRNVGLSSGESRPTATAAVTGLTPGDDTGSPSSTIKVLTSWGGQNEFLPVEDQTSSISSSSRLTRIKGGTGTRRARLARKLIPSFVPPPSDGEGIATSDGPPIAMRDHQHRHHSFLPHLHVHRRKSPVHEFSHNGEIGGQLVRSPSSRESTIVGVREYVAPGISKTLKKARQANREPNVLLAEMRPLPRKFAEVYSALQATSIAKKTTVAGQASTRRPQLPQPAASYMTAMAPLGTGSSLSILPIMSAPLLRTGRIVTATNVASGTTSARATPPPPPPPRIVDPLGTKTFLFKSYQYSMFQGHYIFRVSGDKVQYCKLPEALEQACSQYFREADVTYRSLESKTKEWREKKKVALAEREKEFRELQASKLWITPLNETPIPRPSKRLSSSKSEQQTNSETGLAGDLISSPDMLGIEDGVTEAYTLHSAATEAATLENEEGPEVLIEDEFLFPPGYGYERSNSDPTDLLSEDLRRELEAIANAEASSAAVAGTGAAMSSAASRNEDVDESTLLSDHQLRKRPSFSSLILEVPEERGLVLLQQQEGERWALFKEQQQLEQIQRAYDHAYWLEVEQEHHKASKAALCGLELYLHELLKIAQVEYETFDALTEVGIRNSNKDSTLLTIINGDKTNIMSLESPSLKQKYEFLNWVAVCLMDHGEFLEPDPTQCASIRKQRARLDGVGGGGGQHHPLSSEDDYFEISRQSKQDLNSSAYSFLLETPLRDKASDDSLLELMTIKLALMEVGIRAKREEVGLKMKEIEDMLGRLDNLDDSAKGLMSTMQRAIEGEEVQTALQPSQTTALTLAQTVECKIKDVNERIIICTRIMGAARLNLNRLKYEIELEQRSMRLFRQYKIAITIFSILLLCLGYFLYYQRVEQRLQENIRYIHQHHQARQQRSCGYIGGGGGQGPGQYHQQLHLPTSPRTPLQVILRGGPDAANLPIPETASAYFDHPVESPFEFLNNLQDSHRVDKGRKFIKKQGIWTIFSRTKEYEILCGEELELQEGDVWDEKGMCPAPKLSK